MKTNDQLADWLANALSSCSGICLDYSLAFKKDPEKVLTRQDKNRLKNTWLAVFLKPNLRKSKRSIIRGFCSMFIKQFP